MTPGMSQFAFLSICLALILAGVAVNFLVKLTTLEEQGMRVTPWAYVSEYPYRSISLAVSAIMLALLLHFAGRLTFELALMIGFTADMAADRMRATADRRLSAAEQPKGE
jgi:hypothetical protein